MASFRENFQQAVKELTGGKKEDNATPPEKLGLDVGKLQKAVEDEQPDVGFSGISDLSGSSNADNKTEEENPFKDFTLKSKESAVSDQTPVIPPSNIELGFRDEQKKQSHDTVRDFYNQTNLNAAFPSGEPGHGYSDNNGSDLRAQTQSVNYVKQHSSDNSGMSSTTAPNDSSGFVYPPASEGTGRLRSLLPQSDTEITIISKNTVIDGNIRSFANMSIDGDIKGDIETTKDIDLNGKIVGNLSCNNAEMHNSQIQGNIRMKGHIEMERDTLLIGDIVSTFARVNGKIKGNLDVAGKAELKSDSVVFGDISASTITVDDGAIIQGYVSTTFLNKEESRNIFPDAILISGEGS